MTKVHNEREYEVIEIRLQYKELFVIDYWAPPGIQSYTGLHLNDSGNVATFKSAENAFDFGKLQGFKFVESKSKMRRLNLDAISMWIKAPTIKQINCEQFLMAWHLFANLRNAIEKKDLGAGWRADRQLVVYGMLFDRVASGKCIRNPLPWTREHKTVLCEVFSDGLREFRNRLD